MGKGCSNKVVRSVEVITSVRAPSRRAVFAWVACAALVSGCSVHIPTGVRVRMSRSPLPLEKPPHAKTLPLAKVQRRACFPVLIIADAVKCEYLLRQSQIV
jgi:hypothetical protein